MSEKYEDKMRRMEAEKAAGQIPKWNPNENESTRRKRERLEREANAELERYKRAMVKGLCN